MRHRGEVAVGQTNQNPAQNAPSQSVLAALLNTSASTVQKWEIGEKQPSGPCLKLLSILDQKGIESLDLIRERVPYGVTVDIGPTCSEILERSSVGQSATN